MPRCLVIMYHYIHDPDLLALPRNLDLASGVRGLTPSRFEQQLDELSARYEPLDGSALHRSLHGEAPLPDESFLLTFDDGLADHARFVCPILERRALHGTFFVATSTIHGDRLLAAHALHLLLAALGDAELSEELDRTACALGIIFESSAATASSNADYRYESPLRARLKRRLNFEMATTSRNLLLSEIFRRRLGDPADWARSWYLTAADLRRMAAAGHTIGGHGHTHEPLARLSPTEQETDLTACWHELSETLGKKPRPLSYPFGSFSPDTPAIARRAGFTHAFTTESRWLDPASDAFRLPRVDTIHVSQRTVELNQCPQPS